MSLASPPSVVLQGALTIAAAAEWRARLLAALTAAGDELVLDLAGVDAFDSAGVQLLLATRRALDGRGARLSLQGVTPVVAEALAALGLDELLCPHGGHRE